MGSADLPRLFSTHQPVLWDANRRVRDAKNPMPGPVERLRPERAGTVCQRYCYDGAELIQRETYRNGVKAADKRPEVTRIVRTAPAGTAGGTSDAA